MVLKKFITHLMENLRNITLNTNQSITQDKSKTFYKINLLLILIFAIKKALLNYLTNLIMNHYSMINIMSCTNKEDQQNNQNQENINYPNRLMKYLIYNFDDF